jgi:hypothetical protein
MNPTIPRRYSFSQDISSFPSLLRWADRLVYSVNRFSCFLSPGPFFTRNYLKGREHSSRAYNITYLSRRVCDRICTMLMGISYFYSSLRAHKRCYAARRTSQSTVIHDRKYYGIRSHVPAAHKMGNILVCIRSSYTTLVSTVESIDLVALHSSEWRIGHSGELEGNPDEQE